MTTLSDSHLTLCGTLESSSSMHHCDPNLPCELFRSHITEAYWLLWVHPYSQIKLVNCFNGLFHVDRICAFGGQASGCNWISFMSLVSWIAKKNRNVNSLATYADDSFGPEDVNNITFTKPNWKFCGYGTRLIYLTKRRSKYLDKSSLLSALSSMPTL